jgi:hypothetical protein
MSCTISQIYFDKVKFHPDLASRQSKELAQQIPIAAYKSWDSWWWTADLSETCRVLYQNKFEKLVHLVGFIIRMYHNARSSECQIKSFLLYLHFDMDVLHEVITYKRRVPRTSQMTSRLLRHAAAAMRAHNVLRNSYNTRPLLCACITCYVTVIAHGRCYARA